MKNIHLIPTDKPSRLVKGETTGRLLLHDTYGISTDRNETQHIYITSDGKIKKGDWYIADNKLYRASVNHMPELYIYPCKKIILTTDQELIKDGIQAIDDEFLEWFVNNPSCEEVEVQKESLIIKGEADYFNYDDGKKLNVNVGKYKIIIPKEEPNFYEKLVEYFKNTPREKILEDWNKTAECDDIGPTVEEFLGNTEETLEQAAIRLYPDNIIKLGNETSYNAALLKRKDFIDGGNWVKERMYSEEDMREAIHESRMQDDKYEDCIFEQFKKK